MLNISNVEGGLIRKQATMTSAEDRVRAEKHFKQAERGRAGGGAMLEYEEQASATRSKMARLRTLRLARDAALVRRLRETPKSVK
jgi:hypothetical protein